MNKKAFTLVELIVVITILLIIGTISFLFFSGYSKGARDSKRINDIRSIEHKIVLENLKGKKLSELIVDINFHRVIINGNKTYSNIGVANFSLLGEDEKNFKDPSININYPVAYYIGKDGEEYFNFIQLATINEQKNKAVLFGNYMKIKDIDSPSLFTKKLIDSDGSPIINGEGEQEELDITDGGDILPYELTKDYIPSCPNGYFYNLDDKKCQLKEIESNCIGELGENTIIDNGNNYKRTWNGFTKTYEPADNIEWSYTGTTFGEKLLCKFSCKEGYFFKFKNKDCIPSNKIEEGVSFDGNKYIQNPNIYLLGSPGQPRSFDQNTGIYTIGTNKISNRWYGNTFKYTTNVSRKDISKLKYSFYQSRTGSFYPNVSHGYKWYHTIGHETTIHFAPHLGANFLAPAHRIVGLDFLQNNTIGYYFYEGEVDFENGTYILKENGSIYSEGNIANTDSAGDSPVVIWLWIYNADYSNSFSVKDIKYEIIYNQNNQ